MRISVWCSDVCSSVLLTEAALGRVITSYQGSEAVAESIARRPNLPPAIFEHLVSAMSKKLQVYLVSKHALPDDAAANLLLQPRDSTEMRRRGLVCDNTLLSLW